MRGIKNKNSNKWKKLGVFLVLFFILLVLLNSARKVYEKKKEAERALAQMKDSVVALEKRDQFLRDSIERMNTKEGIEFELRKKLNVAEAGESVAVIVEKEEKAPDENSSVSAWQKVKDFFANLFR